MPSRGSETVGGWGGSSPGAEQRERAELAAGDGLGRYTLLERIGDGAMGIVFAAHDPVLGRDLAIKVLRQSASSLSGAARVRFQREAQALARLSHPNVVSVHDVDFVGERMFVAMELVKGPTLERWLAQASRPWRAVVEVFLEAGRGLEAAHAAGLVHRDFKPSNVILGERVRVADFGLARGVESDDGSAAPASTLLDVGTTVTGQRVGTPAYMAPELRAGAPATAASDQYAFGVALHEALHGARPAEGRPRRAIPAWLQRVVDRTLALEAADRYSSMHALLADLGRDRARARRRWLMATALVALVAGAVPAQRLLSPPPCAGSDELAASLWGAPARARVADAFAKTGRPYAADTFSRVDATMRRRLGGWARERRAACEATHVRHEQSEALLDLRMACLARARDEATQLIALLAEADAGILDRALGAVDKVADITSCADVAALSAQIPPPSDPAIAREDGALRLEAERALALVRLGRYQDSLRAVRALVGRSNDFPHAPTRAAVLRAATTIELTAGDVDAAIALGYEGVRAAEAARDDATRAELLIRLVFALGYKRLRHDEADVVLRLAEAALHRAGDRLELAFLFNFSRGAALEARAALADALGSAIANLGVAMRLGGWPSSPVATALFDLADAQRALGQYRAALGAATAGARVAAAVLGPEHPMHAARLGLQGELATRIGGLELAEAADMRALAIYETAYGPRHEKVALVLNGLADVRMRAGRLDEARADALRAQTALQQTAPDEPTRMVVEVTLAEIDWRSGHLDDARSRLEGVLVTARAAGAGNTEAHIEATLGEIELDRGHPAAARALLERTISAFIGELGASHPDTAEVRIALARVALAERRVDEAVASCAQALPVLETALGDASATTLQARCVCAQVHAAAGDLAAARALAERSDHDAAAPSIDGRTASLARFRLAEALARDGDAGACAAALAARTRAASVPFDPERVEMDRFIAQHRCR